MNSDRIIKTYVWHNEKCFFVSTLERDSSAFGGASRYNETMVWPYNYETKERAPQYIYQGEAMRGSIATHQRVVQMLFEHGIPEKAEE